MLSEARNKFWVGKVISLQCEPEGTKLKPKEVKKSERHGRRKQYNVNCSVFKLRNWRPRTQFIPLKCDANVIEYNYKTVVNEDTVSEILLYAVTYQPNYDL